MIYLNQKQNTKPTALAEKEGKPKNYSVARSLAS